MTVHPVARDGFDRDAERYDKARPGYPAEVVRWRADHLQLATATQVMDLAAGTGKLTRLLAPITSGLVAVEPVDGMRQVLGRALPTVPVLAGTAEALPFRTGSFDEVRSLLRTHPGTQGRERLEIPYRVDAYWCERLP